MSRFSNAVKTVFGDGKKKAPNKNSRPVNKPNAQKPRQAQPFPQSASNSQGAAAISVAPKPAEKKPGFITRFLTQEKFDFSFFLIVIILLAFGLVMLFSSSFASAKYQYNDSYYFVKRQLLFAGGGLFIMLFASTVDYHLFMQKPVLKIATVVSVGLMLLVSIMGKTSWGAERWIQIGDITIQPSEILKLVTIMVIAEYMQRNYDKLDTFGKGLFPILFRIGVACGLVLFQPHLSATVIILVISLCMLFIGGAKTTHMLIILAVIAAAGFAVVYIFPKMGWDYVSTRILSWKDPEADISDKTYQTYQSLITIGSGGMFGLGLGNSRQKYSYLPVTENDFIFSVIVEELGFVGAVLVVLLFIILVVRGFYIASKAPDKFGMLLCIGIVVQIGIQALLNIAVTSNAIPNTGVSLPFISYGGTALLMQLGEMGIVLNISRKAAIE